MPRSWTRCQRRSTGCRRLLPLIRSSSAVLRPACRRWKRRTADCTLLTVTYRRCTAVWRDHCPTWTSTGARRRRWRISLTTCCRRTTIWLGSIPPPASSFMTCFETCMTTTPRGWSRSYPNLSRTSPPKWLLRPRESSWTSAKMWIVSAS